MPSLSPKRRRGRILKFGGSSLESPLARQRCAQWVAERRDRGPLTIVVSAIGDATDRLEQILQSMSRHDPRWWSEFESFRRMHLSTIDALPPTPSKRLAQHITDTLDDGAQLLRALAALGGVPEGERARVLTLGERLSVPVFVATLRAHGIEAESWSAEELLRTRNGPTGTQIQWRDTRRRLQRRAYRSDKNVVRVLAGFVASDEGGSLSTLGRGGSDYTATLVGAALDVDEVEIFSDVTGVHSADPRQVSDTFIHESLHLDDAIELARYGGRVLQPRALEPMRRTTMNVRVLSSRQPCAGFTRIERKTAPKPFVGIATLSGLREVRVRVSSRADAGRQVIESLRWLRPQESHVEFSGSTQGLVAVLEDSTARRWRKEILRRCGRTFDITLGAELSLVSAIGTATRSKPTVRRSILCAFDAESLSVLASFESPAPARLSLAVAPADAPRAAEILHHHLCTAAATSRHPFEREAS